MLLLKAAQVGGVVVAWQQITGRLCGGRFPWGSCRRGACALQRATLHSSQLTFSVYFDDFSLIIYYYRFWIPEFEKYQSFSSHITRFNFDLTFCSFFYIDIISNPICFPVSKISRDTEPQMPGEHRVSTVRKMRRGARYPGVGGASPQHRSGVSAPDNFGGHTCCTGHRNRTFCPSASPDLFHDVYPFFCSWEIEIAQISWLSHFLVLPI